MFYEIKELNQLSNWDNKIEKLIWRGSTTGWIWDKNTRSFTSEVTKENYQFFPRFILVDLGQKMPNIIDASFIQFVQMQDNVKAFLSSKYKIAPFMNLKEQLNYKMQIIVDGNSATYPGFLWRLSSNAVSLKQESPEVQWFYRIVKPMEHFIPVKYDLSDLVEKIEWVKNNDNKAREIAQNANLLVAENLRISDMYQYIFLVLSEYSSLQNFKAKIDKNEIVGYTNYMTKE
ncbi:MAG: glycosyl transferase family 90 [Rickettsiaceae bacterium]|nr:glycosyl transferase family 90 [Rickettsiaceae bacterium]